MAVFVTPIRADGLILRDGVPYIWQFDGGYVSLNANGTPTSWNYYITDHLGSTRKVVDSNNSIKETINYYPFGSEMKMQDPAQMAGDTWQPYRFTSKELDNQNGLNWYDFGARWFDVAGVPMWTSVDPLAEKYYPFTPYSYCAGDPVNKFDPDGRSIWTKEAKLIWKASKAVAKDGLKALTTADTYVSVFNDFKESVNILTDANASTSDKVKAGISLASEALPVSTGDMKDATKVAFSFIHGNSKLSTKAQHAYDIIDKRTRKHVKTGISGGKIRKDGKSYRAEQQVRKWNKEEGGDYYESIITHEESAGPNARSNILEYEQERSKTLRQSGELDNNKHKRP